MKRIALVALVFSVIVLTAGSAQALDISASVEQGIKEFVGGVADQWKKSPESVAALKALGIKEEELPLLMMIAERSNKPPEEIAKQRKAGKSWNDIMVTNKVPPETVYAPAKGTVGPPYGNAYGYFRNRQQKDWKNIKLTDEEAVGLANIKYLSQRQQVPPEEIIRRKAQTKGKTFVAVEGDIKKEKQAKAKANASRPVPPGQQTQGQGRGNSGNNGNGNGQGNGKGNQGGGQGNGRGPKK